MPVVDCTQYVYSLVMTTKHLMRTFCERHNITFKDLSVIIGCDYRTLRKWAYERKVPAEMIPRIEAVTQGELTGRMLRPDLYE